MKQITIYQWATFSTFKEDQVLLRTEAVMELNNPIVLVSQNWKKIYLNKRVCSFCSGNTFVLCRAKLTK